MTTKTDNHNLEAKLELRRYFLRKYHVEGDPPRVLDCCQGSGLLWRELKREFACEVLGVDLKPKKGRLKIDSARLLDQDGWNYDVVDVDTYGAPWKHWFALLKHGKKSLTVFLTIGILKIGGGRADFETMRVLGLDQIFKQIEGRGIKAPHSLASHARDRIGFDACIGGAVDFNFQISELIESDNAGGHARYIGARLSRVHI